MSLRALFPEGVFSPPATEEQISAAEAVLGFRLPEPLRALYLECDGFQEPRGYAPYLLPLANEGGRNSLVSTTQFWWNDWPEITRPNYPIDFKPYVFFGSSSADEYWAMPWRGPGEIIAYHHPMEDTYETHGTSIPALYEADFRLYDELD